MARYKSQRKLYSARRKRFKNKMEINNEIMNRRRIPCYNEQANKPTFKSKIKNWLKKYAERVDYILCHIGLISSCIASSIIIKQAVIEINNNHNLSLGVMFLVTSVLPMWMAQSFINSFKEAGKNENALLDIILAIVPFALGGS